MDINTFQLVGLSTGEPLDQFAFQATILVDRRVLEKLLSGAVVTADLRADNGTITADTTLYTADANTL